MTQQEETIKSRTHSLLQELETALSDGFTEVNYAGNKEGWYSVSQFFGLRSRLSGILKGMELLELLERDISSGQPEKQYKKCIDKLNRIRLILDES